MEGLLQKARREIKYALEHPGSTLYDECMKYKDSPELETKIIEMNTGRGGYLIDEIPEINYDLRVTVWLDSIEMYFSKTYGKEIGYGMYLSWYDSIVNPIGTVYPNCGILSCSDVLHGLNILKGIDNTDWTYIPTDDPKKIPHPELWMWYPNKYFSSQYSH